MKETNPGPGRFKRSLSCGPAIFHEMSFVPGWATFFHMGKLQSLPGWMRTDHQRGDVFIWFV